VLAKQDPGVGWARNLIGLSAGSAGRTSCDTDTDTGSRGMSLSRKCDGLTLQLRSAGLTLQLGCDGLTLRILAHGGMMVGGGNHLLRVEQSHRTEEHTGSAAISNEGWNSTAGGSPGSYRSA
jgi:hypothetical protein